MGKTLASKLEDEADSHRLSSVLYMYAMAHMRCPHPQTKQKKVSLCIITHAFQGYEMIDTGKITAHRHSGLKML